MDIISKKYNDITADDIRKLIVIDTRDDDSIKGIITEDNKKFIIVGDPIIYDKKISPSMYLFKFANKWKKLASTFRHITDHLSKIISTQSSKFFGTNMNKKDIKAKFKPIIEVKENKKIEIASVKIKLFNTTKKANYNSDKVTMLGTEIYYIDNTGKTIYEPAIKAEDFSKKYKSGTKFIPSYMLSSIIFTQKSLKLILTFKALQLLEVPVNKQNVSDYVYSDDECSDGDGDNEDNVETIKPTNEVKLVDTAPVKPVDVKPVDVKPTVDTPQRSSDVKQPVIKKVEVKKNPQRVIKYKEDDGSDHEIDDYVAKKKDSK